MVVTRSQSAAAQRVTRSQVRSKRARLYQPEELVLRRKHRVKDAAARRGSKNTNTKPSGPVHQQRSVLAQAPVPTASLLGLPGEIRNTVYDMILLSPTPLQILDTSIPVQPPLTMVCHQLRAEALPLFYARNTFSIKLHNLDSRPLSRWLSRIGAANFALSGAGLAEEFDNDSRFTKANLMLWLYHYCHGSVVRPFITAERAGDTDCLFGKLFDVADKLRGSPVGWAAVQEILEVAYDLLKSPKPRWA